MGREPLATLAPASPAKEKPPCRPPSNSIRTAPPRPATTPQAASLANVRDRFLRAAAAWEVMAARLARTERMRAETDARKAAEAVVAAEAAEADEADEADEAAALVAVEG